MKLNDIRPNIETSGELEEQFFSIQDQGMIFDILRNKMYSIPILAICREITCNARDAHREVGKADLPIHIQLPNTLEPIYKVKDYGPGISPDRMSNIFIKYTASTKRLDNVQTGGFGLGAKTPFSYSDTFTIKTVYNGTEYNYACFIDETKVGKLALLSSVITDAPNGTEIIIPVKQADFFSFKDWTEKATSYWTIKPVVTGSDLKWVERKKILSGIQWDIVQTANYNQSIKLIIDEVEYSIDIATVKTFANIGVIQAMNGSLLLHFDVGELSLSANREQVYLDKSTQAAILKRINSVSSDIKGIVTDKINKFKNLWDANVFYKREIGDTFHNLSFLGKLMWNGTELNYNSWLPVGCSVLFFSKGRHNRRLKNDPNKIYKSTSNSLRFESESILAINDINIKSLTPKHVQKIFDDNPGLKTVQVICLTDTVTEAMLDKEIALNKFDAIKLSSYLKNIKSKKPTVSGSRLLVFKYDHTDMAFRHVPISSLKTDTNKKVLAELSSGNYRSDGKMICIKDQKYITSFEFKALIANHKHLSFYGVQKLKSNSSIEKKLGDFITFDKFLEDNLLNKPIEFFYKIKLASRNLHGCDDNKIKNYSKYESLITNKDSFFLKRTNFHIARKNMNTTYLPILSLYEKYNEPIIEKDLNAWIKANPDLDIDLVEKEYHKKYPLLRNINDYDSALVPAIAQYINLIDKV